jgi:hypothetical protein
MQDQDLLLQFMEKQQRMAKEAFESKSSALSLPAVTSTMPTREKPTPFVPAAGSTAQKGAE